MKDLTKNVARLVALGAAGFIAGSNLPMAQAQAGYPNPYNYCGYLVAPYSQCSNRSIVVSNARWNASGYPGSGWNSTCQRIERPSDGYLRNRTCSTYPNNYNQSPTANWGNSQGIVGNNDASNHTVNGSISYN